MTSGMSFDVTSALSGLLGIGSILAIVMIGVLILGALYASGIIKNRKYNCFIAEPRANGTVQMFKAKGDHLKNSKFEIFFGPFDTLKVQAPKGECIGPGNQIWGYCRQRNDITWIPWNNIQFDDTQLRAEPAIDPGMKVMVSQTLKEEFERYKVQDKWKEYLPLMSIVVAALIIVLPIMLGLGQIADKLGNTASSMDAASTALRLAIETNTNVTQAASTISSNYPGIPGG